MSAQFYNRPLIQMPSSRRHPFTNAVNHPVQSLSPTKVKKQIVEPPVEPPKNQPASPPLPRQNTKIAPPSPPKVITDRAKTVEFQRVGFLGEGGFARVYEVKDAHGSHLACKVVTKDSLKTKKAKTKLYAEIKIHRSLAHPNIVLFRECFEDELNVYMTLELCPSGSLMDMLRHRRRFTEPEARFFMVQLIGACHYMHTHQVIHRDLKLGNLFLDNDMNIKVGDFGLAALIEKEGERKKTICGTPNYIAPEVLFDTANGHSFEVDIWSVGVILYTLVIGRPPFQTKEVKSIYKRIRDNQYDFPVDRYISPHVQLLIQKILTPDPQERPRLHAIVDHPFFTQGTVPSYIPATAHDTPPDFRRVTRLASEANLAELKRKAGLVGEVRGIAVSGRLGDIGGRYGDGKSMLSTSIAQQEKEFREAVQPGSPISALLSSARQPLIVAGNIGPMTRENTLFRKLTNAAREKEVGRGLGGIAEEPENVFDGMRERVARTRGEDAGRKELASQKARIVAQMVPVQTGSEDQENVPPPRKRETGKGKEKEVNRGLDVGPEPATPTLMAKPNTFEATFNTLSAALTARASGKVFRDPSMDADLNDEPVFIVSWVDYCHKYGMGYALTDGSVGVHFNDTTMMVLSPDKTHFDYITTRLNGTVYVRKSHTVSAYSEELKSKVYLLKHFERYIMDRLYGAHEWCYEDLSKQKGMHFVQKYLRMKHVIVFKMSNDCLQFNFYDHTKIVLSCSGLMITHIDKNNLTRWKLSEVMANANSASSSSSPSGLSPDEAKFQQKLLDKLKYCKEVLGGIMSASAEAEVRALPPVVLKRNYSRTTLR